MIQSKFISSILDLLLEGDEAGMNARRQLDFLTDNTYTYTTLGVFITFDHTEGIEPFRMEAGNINIDGVIIDSPELDYGATAMVVITNGLVDYLEIWARGAAYPERDLAHYTLTQVWEGSPGREIRVA